MPLPHPTVIGKKHEELGSDKKEITFGNGYNQPTLVRNTCMDKGFLTCTAATMVHD
jgi:hypothetical protein